MPRLRKPAAVPGASYQPAAIFHITSPAQLKALSDPLRLQIIETVAKEAHTVKQIAERLGQPPTKLYYHVSALEEAGFVTLVETRVKSGILEKYYRNTAENIEVDRKLLKMSSEREATLEAVLSVVFDATLEDLHRSFAAGLLDLSAGDRGGDAGRLILSRALCKLRRDDVPKFIAKFQALLKELVAGDAAADVVNYACTIAFYPQVQAAKGKKSRRRRA
jgi:DNA-binding transcriptional ArsR family regulator